MQRFIDQCKLGLYLASVCLLPAAFSASLSCGRFRRHSSTKGGSDCVVLHSSCAAGVRVCPCSGFGFGFGLGFECIRLLFWPRGRGSGLSLGGVRNETQAPLYSVTLFWVFSGLHRQSSQNIGPPKTIRGVFQTINRRQPIFCVFCENPQKVFSGVPCSRLPRARALSAPCLWLRGQQLCRLDGFIALAKSQPEIEASGIPFA